MSLQRSTRVVRYAIASLLVKSSIGFVSPPRATAWIGWSHESSFAAHHNTQASLQRGSFRTFLQSPSSSSNTNDDDTSNTTTQSSVASTSGASSVRSQKPLPTDSDTLQMISFYKFSHLTQPEECRDILFEKIQEIPGLRGSIYLAQEGINAQMAVPPEHLDELVKACSTSLSFDLFADDEEKPNLGNVVPISTPTFNRLIVRTRDYVLRDGIDDHTQVGGGTTLDWNNAGPELEANEWHEAVIGTSSSNSKGTLLDCRNLYESDEGTFRGATPLETNTFQDSWSQLDGMTKDLSKDEPVYIFCTGGIRCVKVGAYLKQHLGFDNVKRLKNGIIGYQKWADEETSDETSAWEGENFLFDKRREEKENDSKEEVNE